MLAEAKGRDSPEAGECELPDVGDGYPTQVPWKNMLLLTAEPPLQPLHCYCLVNRWKIVEMN